jgi:DNA repair exonuclease SbcCD ATPase subunit
MPKHLVRKLVTGAVALFMIAGFLLVDSSAQKRRRKRKSRPTAPRITNPAIYQPSPGDNANSNSSGDTSNENATDTTPANTQAARPAADEDPQKTIRTLSTQVDKLTNKINQMEESQRSLVDLERLSRAEARSSALHVELRDVEGKASDLEARAEDIEFALKPENIERSTAGYGTTHPEELREQRRKQLESEKQRVRKQLDQLAASRTRLEQAIASSDAEVERLRKKLDAADEAATQDAKKKAESEGTSSSESGPRPRPSPSPYPPR